MQQIRPARLDAWPDMVAAKIAAGMAAWVHFLPAELLEKRNPPDRWRDAISDPDQTVFVAEVDGVAAGFCHLRHSGDDDAQPETGELDSFYVHPDYWGKGVGRDLMAAALTRLAEMGFDEATLWTAELNHRPRRIYEVSGWGLDGGRRERSLERHDFLEIRYRRSV